MRDTASVSSRSFKAKHALTSPAAYLGASISLLTLGFLGLTLAPNLSPTDTYADSSSSEMNVRLAEVLDFAIEIKQEDGTYASGSNMPMHIRNGEFKTSTARITAGTNRPTGYELTISNKDSYNDLMTVTSTSTDPVNGDTVYEHDTSGAKISALSSNTSISTATDTNGDFPENSWGYSLKTTSLTASEPDVVDTYKAITNSSETLHTTDTPGDNYHYFTIASRVGANLPAGSYQDELTISVTANPLPTPAFYTITNMQQMTASICNSVDTPLASVTNITANDGSDYVSGGNIVPSTTLIDSRDGQSYTVRKFADGNCWMTNDLKYASAAGNGLYTTAEYSDGTIFSSKGTHYVNKSICPSNWAIPDYTGVDIYTRSSTVSISDIAVDVKTDGSLLDYNNLLKLYSVTDSGEGSLLAKSYPINFLEGNYWVPKIGYRSNAVFTLSILNDGVKVAVASTSYNTDTSKVRCVASEVHPSYEVYLRGSSDPV